MLTKRKRPAINYKESTSESSSDEDSEEKTTSAPTAKRHNQEKPQAARRSKRLKHKKKQERKSPAAPTPTLDDVLPEEELSAFALSLPFISKIWKRDLRRHGGTSGQKFTPALASEIARELLVAMYGPLENNLTDKQRERIWELLPGVLVEADGEVKVVTNSDITRTGPDGEAVKVTGIFNNNLSGFNALKILAYLSYIAVALPILVTLRLSDPCDTKLRLAAKGKDLKKKELPADE
ncbi:hypothetical protein TrRE_jg7474, partial [Triparma retinervis]